ncbi:chromosome partitioning protein [bacterium]|nr:MAG: chromosome partitioning protein [bacterium]RKZ17022.1 MAG: chromosome partitioning protein [bacterium]
MSQPTVDQVREALSAVQYPGFTRDIVSFGLIKDLQVSGAGDVAIVIEHTITDGGVLERIRRDVDSAVSGLSGVGRVDIAMREKQQTNGAAPAQPAATAAQGPQGIPGVKHVVAVASAKGGVGKSTVAANLTLALAAKGQKVGLLDADIYGPSVPTMFGIHDRPRITDERRIHPLERDGIKLISMGFLVPPDKALIWRGPMVMGAVQQLIHDCEWGELDTLVVDLPPGTGDAQLTLVQQVALSGVVMVTTPQEVALIDVVRGIQMFESTNVPIVGVVENMSGFVCSHCGEVEDIFGSGGGEQTARRYGVPFLGAIPIDSRVVRSGDGGQPIVSSNPDSPAALALNDVAGKVAEFLASR